MSSAIHWYIKIKINLCAVKDFRQSSNRLPFDPRLPTRQGLLKGPQRVYIVRREGFEPSTVCLKGNCSTGLS